MKVYHLNGPAPLCTNTYLLISEKKNAVILDPAADATAYNRLLGQEGAQLVAILCTHGHADHVGAAETLKAQWPDAKLYCEAADLRGNWLFPLRSVDCGYEEGKTIQVDEMAFRVWHTPGHTEGSVCILCGDLFFTGDTLFAGDTGRTDLEGGDPAKMIASCKKIMGLPIPPQAQVLPGHEGSSTYEREMRTNFFIQAMCR